MNFSTFTKTYFFSWKGLIILYLLLSLMATIVALSRGDKVYEGQKTHYTYYNNYLIFKNSYSHLKANANLYKDYPEEVWDLYKYSPTFAIFFAPLSLMPDWLGLSLWNIINVFALVFAIYFLPGDDKKRQLWILLALVIEVLTSIQNQQSNGLMAGLMIGAFALMERDKLFWAAGLLMFSVYVKLFGLVGFALFLFYPNKIKAAYSTLIWGVILFALPLINVDFHSLIVQYKNWGVMLANDHDGSLGFSVLGWLSSWFHLNINKNLILLIGVVLYLIPVIKFKKWEEQKFRLLMLSSTLIWVVIFNHKAESPTFVIAMAGALIWFFNSPKTKFNTTLFILAMVFTSLSPTDIFPAFIRNEIFIPYCIKVVPMILIWGKIIYELAVEKSPKRLTANTEDT